jgi:hypothetical protein
VLFCLFLFLFFFYHFYFYFIFCQVCSFYLPPLARPLAGAMPQWFRVPIVHNKGFCLFFKNILFLFKILPRRPPSLLFILLST